VNIDALALLKFYFVVVSNFENVANLPDERGLRISAGDILVFETDEMLSIAVNL
jgi:hypothetical protein